MSAFTVYVIRCDLCDADFETGYGRVAQARADAAGEGWTRPVGNPTRSRLRIDACPACSEIEGA